MQTSIPKPEQTSERQEYGFEITDFIADNWLYLLAVLFVVIVVVYYAIEKRRLRKREQKDN
ncbi:MAG: hypothetical protein ACQESK_04025 [Bacteroidota bacterium]